MYTHLFVAQCSAGIATSVSLLASLLFASGLFCFFRTRVSFFPCLRTFNLNRRCLECSEKPGQESNPRRNRLRTWKHRYTPPALLNLTCFQVLCHASPLYTEWYKLQSVFSNSCRNNCLF